MVPVETELASTGTAPVTEPTTSTTTARRNMREQMVDVIDPLQKQLDAKLHELDETLRPRLEQPVKDKPLLSVAVSAGVGVLVGALTVMAILAGARSKAE